RNGSHVEQDVFYDLCDEMGLLVWQVFPFHHGYIVDTDDLVERCAVQIRDMVAQLYNHACVAAWSTWKEPEVYGVPGRPKPNHYNRACEIMAETARAYDSTRWIHKGDYRDNVQNVTIGKLRPHDTDIKSIHIEPMVVEYGSGSVPCLETLQQLLKPEDIWPPNWDAWARIGFFPGFVPNWGVPLGESIEAYIERTQHYHYLNTKELVEFFRQRKYRPITAIIYNWWREQYPGFGSGLVDYFGRRYKAVEALKLASAPLLVSVEWIKDRHIVGDEKVYRPGAVFQANVWLTNDTAATVAGSIQWTLRRDGEVCASRTLERVTAGADTSQIVDQIVQQLPSGVRRYRIDVTFGDGQSPTSQNWFEFAAR
ncbi:MAG: hypothetical protein ACRDI2_16580, partial [Chloroflexota bacterium]